MNVEIGTEAAQFPENEYIYSGIFIAIRMKITPHKRQDPHPRKNPDPNPKERNIGERKHWCWAGGYKEMSSILADQ